MKYIAGLVILVLGFSCWNPAAAAEADLVIAGVIRRQMTKAAKELAELAKNKEEINMVIDSPGGSVYRGWQFMSAMQQVQAKGVILKCYVSGMAASMAFQILSYCDERYALPFSRLLWHSVRANPGKAMLPSEALRLARHLKETEDELIKQLRANFKVDDSYFFRHYKAETLHLTSAFCATTPGFLEMVEEIPEITKNTKIPAAGRFFFSELNYINDRALNLYNRGN